MAEAGGVSSVLHSDFAGNSLRSVHWTRTAISKKSGETEDHFNNEVEGQKGKHETRCTVEMYTHENAGKMCSGESPRALGNHLTKGRKTTDQEQNFLSRLEQDPRPGERKSRVQSD
jgi:hypothetical protein